MDISKWPMGRIMNLPDHCFGRRFPVFCYCEQAGIGFAYDISEEGLPEQCVLWELHMRVMSSTSFSNEARIVLADKLPANILEFQVNEPLYRGWGLHGPDPRLITVYGDARLHLDRLKFPIHAAGRKLCLELRSTTDHFASVEVIGVFSAMPTEVPDCLLSV